MGFDAAGKYLLTVTHSGRGVFSTETWERVARDTALAYPADGKAVGIGPIDGQVIAVQERDEQRSQIEMQSPDGRYRSSGSLMELQSHEIIQRSHLEGLRKNATSAKGWMANCNWRNLVEVD